MIKDQIFRILLEKYGYQGWWPITSRAGKDGFDEFGYHSGDYKPPYNKTERFEIIIGALLTQNTSWLNVEKAIQRMQNEGLMTPESILKIPLNELSFIIKSSGYYNEKAKKLKHVSEFFIDDIKLEEKSVFLREVTREKLLSLWGIGRETADSILLYAYHYPIFVVDTYTKRILSRIGFINGDESYDEIQIRLMHYNSAPQLKYEFYNEYHALFVQHAKQYCRKKPLCEKCLLKDLCRTGKANTGIMSNERIIEGEKV